jgi:hypothetical protein
MSYSVILIFFRSALHTKPHSAIYRAFDVYWLKGVNVGYSVVEETEKEAVCSVHLPPGCAFFSDIVYTGDTTALRPPSFRAGGGLAVAWWAFLFIMAMLVPACHGLVAMALKLLKLETPLTPKQYGLLGGGVVFMLVVEGYVGFHRSWAPATARRALIFPYGAFVRLSTLKPSHISTMCC